MNLKQVDKHKDRYQKETDRHLTSWYFPVLTSKPVIIVFFPKLQVSKETPFYLTISIIGELFRFQNKGFSPLILFLEGKPNLLCSQFQSTHLGINLTSKQRAFSYFIVF